MQKRFSFGLLALIIGLTSSNADGEEPLNQGRQTAENTDEFEWFALQLSPHARRKYVTPRDGEPSVRIDAEKLSQAIQKSVYWIKMVLKPEFIPEDLESLIEPLPAAMESRDYDGQYGKGARFDCTIAEFEKNGYRFLITQEAGQIAFFVSRVEGSLSDRRPTNPGAWAKLLQESSKEFFNHAAAGLYTVTINLSDFGAETGTSWAAQYSQKGYRGWKATVIVPPKACDDGAMNPGGGLNHDVFVAKVKKADPTLTEQLLDGYNTQWWKGVYAATDGRVLMYSVAKLSGGQAGNYRKADWFRIAEPGEIPDCGSKVPENMVNPHE